MITRQPQTLQRFDCRDSVTDYVRDQFHGHDPDPICEQIDFGGAEPFTATVPYTRARVIGHDTRGLGAAGYDYAEDDCAIVDDTDEEAEVTVSLVNGEWWLEVTL